MPIERTPDNAPFFDAAAREARLQAENAALWEIVRQMMDAGLLSKRSGFARCQRRRSLRHRSVLAAASLLARALPGSRKVWQPNAHTQSRTKGAP